MNNTLFGDGINDLDARRPMASATWIAKGLWGERLGVAIDEVGVILKTELCSGRKYVIVGFYDVEERIIWTFDKLPGRESQRNRLFTKIA